MEQETFYERIKRLCKDKCITVEGLMISCGLTKDTFAKWRRRETFPRSDSLQKMSKCLDVSMDYLMTGEEDFRLNPRVMAIAKFLSDHPEKLDAIEVLLFEKNAGQSSKFS